MACLYSLLRKGLLSQRNTAIVACVRHRKIKPWEDEYEQPTFVYAEKKATEKVIKVLYTVGCGSQGQLGHKSIFVPKNNKKLPENLGRPIKVQFGTNIKVIDVACGIHFTLFVIAAHEGISCLGTGLATDGQIGVHYPKASVSKNGRYFTNAGVEGQNGERAFDVIIHPIPVRFSLQSAPAQKVACGRAHSMISTREGSIYTFGNNAYGQCGRQIIPKEVYNVKSNFHKINTFKGKPIDQIVCGMDTSFVVTAGKVYSCGLSADGQTGQGTYDSVTQFGPVKGLINSEVVTKLHSSADCVLAVTESGKVFGWGNGEYKQFSMVTDESQLAEPVLLPLGLGKIIDVVATGSACFVLTESGDVWSWGQGWLGRGPEAIMSSRPELIPATLFGRNVLSPNSKVVRLEAGVSMVTAINSEGNLYSWGNNNNGCLGLGHKVDMFFPLRVCIGKKVRKVSCGEAHIAIVARAVL